MAYKVIKSFADLKDYNHEYNVGDTFPRVGVEVSAERIAELSGRQNRQGVPLIEEAKDKRKKKTAEK